MERYGKDSLHYGVETVNGTTNWQAKFAAEDKVVQMDEVSVQYFPVFFVEYVTNYLEYDFTLYLLFLPHPEPSMYFYCRNR